MSGGARGVTPYLLIRETYDPPSVRAIAPEDAEPCRFCGEISGVLDFREDGWACADINACGERCVVQDTLARA